MKFKIVYWCIDQSILYKCVWPSSIQSPGIQAKTNHGSNSVWLYIPWWCVAFISNEWALEILTNNIWFISNWKRGDILLHFMGMEHFIGDFWSKMNILITLKFKKIQSSIEQLQIYTNAVDYF